MLQVYTKPDLLGALELERLGRLNSKALVPQGSVALKTKCPTFLDNLQNVIK